MQQVVCSCRHLAQDFTTSHGQIHIDGIKLGHLRRFDAVGPFIGVLQASAGGPATSPHDPKPKSQRPSLVCTALSASELIASGGSTC
jgi:hypothetical protein